MNKSSRICGVTAVVTLGLAPAALAAGMTITGDDGQPHAVAEGTPAQIRYMTPKMMPTFSGSEGQYSLRVTNPAGQDAGASVDCQSVTSPAPPDAIDYSGNGTYTVQLNTYGNPDDVSCLQPSTTQTFTFTITAGTAVHPPASTLLRRKPGNSSEIHHIFKLDLNPGAKTYDVSWTASGHKHSEIFDANGTQDVEFFDPGIYTFVASAMAGLGSSPLSAPVKVRVMGPFDFNGPPSILPAGHSKYELEGTLGDGRSAVGQPVAVSIAKGKGHFRPIAKPKIDSDGNIDFKFRKAGHGRYRVRYAFKGSNLLARGAWVQGLTLGSRPSAEPKLVHSP